MKTLRTGPRSLTRVFVQLEGWHLAKRDVEFGDGVKGLCCEIGGVVPGRLCEGDRERERVTERERERERERATARTGGAHTKREREREREGERERRGERTQRDRERVCE